MSKLELHIEPNWRKRLERAGLTDPTHFFSAEVGRTVQRKPGREVRHLAPPGGGPGTYLK